MSHGDERLEARVSAWLSDELEPAAADAVVRALAGDGNGRRMAGDYRRADEAVRVWYHGSTLDTLHWKPVDEHRPLRRVLAVAVAVMLIVGGAFLGDGSARAFETTVDMLAARVCAVAGDSPLRLERCSYWEMRPTVDHMHAVWPGIPPRPE